MARDLGYADEREELPSPFLSEAEAEDSEDFGSDPSRRWRPRAGRNRALDGDGVPPASFGESEDEEWSEAETDLAPGTEHESVFDTVLRGAVRGMVASAIAAGERDPSKLTNKVFYLRHPQLQGQRIRPDQVNHKQEWLAIRQEIVLPALGQGTGAARFPASQAPSRSAPGASGEAAATLAIGARPVPGMPGVTIRELVEKHRVGICPEIPIEILLAFVRYESGGRFDDATHGTARNGWTSPPFYELGLFQTPAGLHGRCTGRDPASCANAPPGAERANDRSTWSRLCRQIGADPQDWQNPTTQVRVGLLDLEHGAKRIREAFPELFASPGSDWDLRMAVLYPFSRGGGAARSFLAPFRSALAALPEEQRWDLLRDKSVQVRSGGRSIQRSFKGENVEKKMALARLLGYVPKHAASAGKEFFEGEANSEYLLRDDYAGERDEAEGEWLGLSESEMDERASNEYESESSLESAYELPTGPADSFEDSEGFESFEDLEGESLAGFDGELFEQLVTSGSVVERILVIAQVALGRRDSNQLTDYLFYRRHPELAGTRLGPGQEALMAEWRQIQAELVVPALARANATPTPPVGPAPAQTLAPFPAPAISGVGGDPDHALLYDGTRPAPGTFEAQPSNVTTPPIAGNSSNRNRMRYDNVINQFAVGANPRYRQRTSNGKTSTYCNIFLWDVTRAMGVEIPHWVSPQGDPVAPFKGSEMNANYTYDWLFKHGSRFGWRQVADPAEAQRLASEGRPVISAWKNPKQGHAGHVTVIRPGELTDKGPAMAQAGATNTNNTRLYSIFGTSKSVTLWANA